MTQPQPPSSDEDPTAVRKRALINDFAIRSFRDIADQDYIAARMAYRAQLWPQFRWSALQAVEKYIKGILLLNRIPAKDLGHKLKRALSRCKKLPFELRLSPRAKELIEYLDRGGRFRYLEGSYSVWGPQLVELDHSVWQLRRYCKVMDHEITRPNGERINLMEAYLATIQDAEERPFHLFRIGGGEVPP